MNRLLESRSGRGRRLPLVGAGRSPARSARLEPGQRPGRQLEPKPGERQEDRPAGRLVREPRQPQPVHRPAERRLRHLPSELRLSRQLRRQHAGADPRRRDELVALRRRQNLDVQDPPGRQVAGRSAAHRRRRRLHLQLHHQEPDDRLHQLHPVHQGRRRPRPLHRAFRLRQAQGRHPADVGTHPPRAHLEQDQPGRRAEQVPEPGAGRRQRRLPGGRLGEGPVRAHGGQQELLGRGAQDRRDPLSHLHQSGDRGRRPAVGLDPVRRRRPRAVSVVRRQDDLDDAQGDRRLLREHGRRLLHAGPVAGQPGAQGLAVSQRAQLGHRPPRRSPPSPTTAPHSRRPASCRAATGRRPSTTTGSRRQARPTATIRRRPGGCSTRPATRRSTACASTTTASRSSCGCGR